MVGYGAALGAASRARGGEWATELLLFESAMRVCPRSLKVPGGGVRALVCATHTKKQLQKALCWCSI